MSDPTRTPWFFRTVFSRRTLLGVVAGGAGAWWLAGGDVPEVPPAIQRVIDQRSHDEDAVRIKSEQAARGEFIERVDYFADGFAEVWFPTEHDFDRFAFTHSSKDVRDDAYEIWQAPDFEGPKVVDLQAIIRVNGPFPNRKFKFGPRAPAGEAGIYMARNFHTTVPKPFFEELDTPAATPSPSATNDSTVEF